ncbi:hypothetical protein PL321_11815 [Caloramator sp. mosi_1]|uniref:hypothetical protein n=1 Tax=Caloramator sp. mosi_1 TaxID=3023090 RepID=UPI00235E95E5|nr:hypothetical protein [Caloramator sp. mosi_1]WDC83424.1 hypothetical protein PL321_11815 [Caloramator sp. mosi_1]
MDKLAQLCVQNNVQVFTYSPVLPFGRANNITWSSEDLIRLKTIEQEIREKYKKLYQSYLLKSMVIMV